MRLHILFTATILCLCACQSPQKKPAASTLPTTTAQAIDTAHTIDYAVGFKIEQYERYKIITVATPWTTDRTPLTYLLYPKGSHKPTIVTPPRTRYIPVPIERVIVTSTTDIPMLEYLGIEDKLVGFPTTDYISSPKTRARITANQVQDIGNTQELNTEMAIALHPDLIIGFTSDGSTKAYDPIEQAHIPVVMNGAWLEQHPLGRAEWIKFIAAFFDKEQEAARQFATIEKNYLDATAIAQKATSYPTVISGNMIKDIWYLPGGDSYLAHIFKDAHTEYIWHKTPDTGSLAFNFETVLEKAQNTDLWIGAGNAASLADLKKNNNKYVLFQPFKNKTVYSSTLKVGEKGGMVYYELGALRPDLILKDCIHIAHPELVPEYEPYFFKKLE